MLQIFPVINDTVNNLIKRAIMFFLTQPACATPTQIPYAESWSTSPTSDGTQLTITCLSGYVLQGSSYIECLTSGDWSTPPDCVPGNMIVIVNVLPSLQWVQIYLVFFIFHSHVFFKCNRI